MPQPCSLGHSAAKSPAEALLPVIAKHGHSALPAAAAQPECWTPAWPACMRREAAPGLLTPLAVSFAADSVTEVPQRGRTASREARRERTQRRQQYAERLSLSHGGKREPVAPLAPPIMREKLEEEDGDAVVLDKYTAIAEGSIGAIQRRVMVTDDDLARACFVLQEATNL